MKKDFIYLALLIIFLAGAAFYFLSPSKAKVLPYRPIDVGGGSITVEDQPNLNTVTLNAELAVPGFITIHEALGRSPADIIGTSAFLETGAHEDIVINLTEPMAPGFMYITLLHADNGDGRYETMDDLPVMVDEAVVRPDFVARPEDARIIIPGSEESKSLPDVNEQTN